MLQTDNLTAAQPQRIVAAQTASAQEELLERALRPKTLDDYIGQHKAKEQLAIFIQAAKNAAKHSTTSCFSARPDWAKPPLPTSSPKSWA